MRILLLTTDAYGGHGGIALYNRDIADGLAEMSDVDEVVVVPRTMPFAPTGVPTKVRFLSKAAGSKSRYLRCSAALIGSRFDLVICGHINLLPLARLLNLKLRAPLALMVYGIDVWTAPSRLSRRLLSGVDAVWSISEVTRDRMNAWAGLPVGRYMLLPNAIHLERYGMAERNQALQERYGLVGKRVVMTLARLPSFDRFKGVDEMLQVMPDLLQQMPDLMYLVAGTGNDRPRLEAKAAELGLAEQVVFAGFVPEEDKADHFRLADAFVMPGRSEGFGFVFLEALACGVPAVGSAVDGSREALLDGVLGELVNPADLASVRDGTLRALLKPKGVPAAIEHFGWRRFCERLEKAVQSLVSSSLGRV
jgi:glycosyltransferase involved in cell wall biosynthesis